MKTPYDIYKKEIEWKIINKAIKSLEKNNDLILTTQIDYVVGYICKELSEKNRKKI